MPCFEVVTSIAAPLEQVFAASLDVETHTRSMAASGERVVGGREHGGLVLGETVTFEARHFGVRWRLTARITGFDPPRSFVDEQLSGPFREWRHVHRFESDDVGGTVMRDIVEFRSPLGVLGRIADALVLGRYMPRLIRTRNAHLAAVVGGCSSE